MGQSGPRNEQAVDYGKSQASDWRWLVRKPGETTRDAAPCPSPPPPSRRGLAPCCLCLEWENFRDHPIPRSEGQGNWDACPLNKRPRKSEPSGLGGGPWMLMTLRCMLSVKFGILHGEETPSLTASCETGGQRRRLLGAEYLSGSLSLNLSQDQAQPLPVARFPGPPSSQPLASHPGACHRAIKCGYSCKRRSGHGHRWGGGG